MVRSAKRGRVSNLSDQLELDRNITARMMAQRFIRSTLYPTDTPLFSVEVITAQPVDDIWTVILTSSLPDGMIYMISWETPGKEPVLKAFKYIDPEEIQPH